MAGVCPEPLDQLGFLLEDPDRGQARRRDRRRVRGGEEEWPAALDQHLPQGERTGHVSAEDAHRLAHRPDLDGDPPVQVEVVDRPPPVAPEDARGMGVVDEDGGVVLLGCGNDRGQGGDVAVHAEHAVGHDQDRPVGLAVRPPVAARGGQELAQVGHVLVAVDHPGRLGEAHPVDDRGVVELVGDDQVRLAGHDRDDPGVAGEAGLEGEHGLHVLERGKRRFQLLVDAHRPGDGADGPRAGAEPPGGVGRRLDQPGVRVQPQVVVRGEADHLPPVDRHARPVRRAHHAQRPVEVGGSQLVELGRQVGEGVGAGGHRVGLLAGGADRRPARLMRSSP